MSEEKRWLRIMQGLHLAVRLRFPVESAPVELPEMEKYPAPGGAKQQNFYWPLDGRLTRAMCIAVPPEGIKAERCELRFRRRNGYRVFFARHGEKNPFGFNEGDYINLRLDPQEREGAHCRDFNPLYIRVDKGSETTFSRLTAKWEKNNIVIAVSVPDPADIPEFLVNLPESIEIRPGVFLKL